jgi:hypothetical protein
MTQTDGLLSEVVKNCRLYGRRVAQVRDQRLRGYIAGLRKLLA